MVLALIYTWDLEDVTNVNKKKMLKVKLCDFIVCEKFRFDGKHIKNASYKEFLFGFGPQSHKKHKQTLTANTHIA